jgi:hypothetical protein
MSLQTFASSAALPAAELSLPSSPNDLATLAPAAAAPLPSNLKIMIAQALYPGIPVFA